MPEEDGEDKRTFTMEAGRLLGGGDSQLASRGHVLNQICHLENTHLQAET